MTKNRLLFARPKPDFCSGKQAAGIADQTGEDGQVWYQKQTPQGRMGQ
jgi:hypothetical protein